jgi:hypothetical protein
MRAKYLQSLALATLAGGAVVFGSSSARAVNPLEYPDNGSASFSRGGAWLAVANEPIATHYNPAGLALQGSGFSIEQQLNFQHICYDRHGPDGAPEYANPAGTVQYLPVCNERNSFPSAIPSISMAWRVNRKLGLGLAVVPPAAYGNPDEGFPLMKLGTNTITGEQQLSPASYRYQQLNQQSLIIFPTIGVGYEVIPNLRVGAAFISGIAVVNATVAGIEHEGDLTKATDHAGQDTISTLQAKDLFVPGVILSLHWSPLPVLDVAAWGRYVSDAYTSQGNLTVVAEPYNNELSSVLPICRESDTSSCTGVSPKVATVNKYGNETFRHLRLPYPPEVRIGVRYHHLRSNAPKRAPDEALTMNAKPPVRDPLHEDLFDVELDGSYTMSASANTVEIRFVDGPGSGFANGMGVVPVAPQGQIPPNADKWNGWKDSIGFRLGGQVNVIQDKLGIRAGTWFETQSQDPKWLSISNVGATRGGFGGGIVFRQDFLDISLGYQYHWSSGLDNGGNGAMRAVVGLAESSATFPPYNTNRDPAGTSAADVTQFRSGHSVNDGRITQSAHAFTLGGTIRF